MEALTLLRKIHFCSIYREIRRVEQKLGPPAQSAAQFRSAEPTAAACDFLRPVICPCDQASCPFQAYVIYGNLGANGPRRRNAQTGLAFAVMATCYRYAPLNLINQQL